jgi:hypothetical protein
MNTTGHDSDIEQQSWWGTTLTEPMRLRTTYQLSSRQRKKLLQSHCRLTIAIPVPPEVPDGFDPKRVIGLAMPHDYWYCSSAEYQMLLVQPPIPSIELGGLSPTKGTHGLFGEIIEDDAKSVRPVAIVACVVAVFNPTRPRGPLGEISLKWAGRVFHDGKEVAAETERETPQGPEVSE